MDESKDLTFNTSLSRIRDLIKNGQNENALQEIKKSISKAHSYYQVSTLQKAASQIQTKGSAKIKVAMGGKCTLDPMVELLKFYFKLNGYEADIYLSQFGTIQQDLLNESSELYQFKPDFIFIFNSMHDLDFLLSKNLSAEQASQFVLQSTEEMKNLVAAAQGKINAQVILSNFDLPSVRVFSNFERQVETSASNIYNRLNQEMDQASKKLFTVFDLNYLSERFGKEKWFSNRFWYEGKYPFSLEATPVVAFALFRLLESMMGKAKKCLVFDLDNTIWGGIVGEEGALGVNISRDNSEGEAFSDLQRYILNLKNRGILLAVCSKNDESLAQEVFLKNTNMLLRLQDISVFKANWKNKADNLKEIAQELNIGLDSMVFFDDSAFERNLVRELLPEVAVVEISEDPTESKEQLVKENFFEVAALTDEDFKRSLMYQQEKLRTVLKSEAKTEDEYLKNLNMRAQVTTIKEDNIDRCVQLINKSNQYNLLGTKTTVTAMTNKKNSSDSVIQVFSLSDKFGDNGIVAIVSMVVNSKEKSLEIDGFTMSCRVLMRGFESYIHEQICKIAVEKNLENIKGKIIKTGKNKISTNHFEKLNFKCLENNEQESTWIFNIKSNASLTSKHFITTDGH